MPSSRAALIRQSPEGLQEGEISTRCVSICLKAFVVFTTGGLPPLVKHPDLVYKYLFSKLFFMEFVLKLMESQERSKRGTEPTMPSILRISHV